MKLFHVIVLCGASMVACCGKLNRLLLSSICVSAQHPSTHMEDGMVSGRYFGLNPDRVRRKVRLQGH